MYEVLNVCFGVIVILGQGYLLQYFLGSFLESRGKDRRRNGLLVMAGYGVLRLVLDEILPSDYESIRTVGKMALLFAAIVLLALLFYKGVHAITAFLGITFMAVSELTFFLSYMLLQAGGRLFDVWEKVIFLRIPLKGLCRYPPGYYRFSFMAYLSYCCILY